MASDEDVPPLEDMSELIQNIDAIRQLKKDQKQSSQTARNNANEHANVAAKQTESKIPDLCTPGNDKQIKAQEHNHKLSETQSSDAAQAKSNFAGMKKGFLFGGTKSQKVTVYQTEKSDANSLNAPEKDIPYLRKNEQIETDHYRFAEVQEVMRKANTTLMESNDWLTEDLFTKLQKNEMLTKRLQDPTFVRAIGEFEKNPQDAKRKYGDNKEMQEFLYDFCNIMGEHFNKLADKKLEAVQKSVTLKPEVTSPIDGTDIKVRSSTNPKQATAEDELKMQQILSDPEVRFILMDPKIQELFDILRSDPKHGDEILKTATGEFHQKIQKLVQVGLLQFQR